MSPAHDLRTWRRLGLAVEAAGGPLTRSHAMLPAPLLLEDRIRVFFASCDGDLRGRIFFADLDRTPPHRVLTIEERPALDLGERGAFDYDGVNPSQVFHHNGELLLLYIGWQRDVDGAAYTLLGGLAVSRDDGRTFERIKAPLLPRSRDERLFRTAPFVRPLAGGGWEMLYISGSHFIRGEARSFPVYSLVGSRSDELDAWPDRGDVLLAPDTAAGEIGFGRPVLWRERNGELTLLLSRRTRTGYALEQASYAAVENGQAAFQPVLAGPAAAWEADMTCFGAPLRLEDGELLFYNGDQFGRTGFGLAWREP